MSAIHSASHETNIESIQPDLAAIQKEIQSLREHLASMSKILIERVTVGAADVVKPLGEAGKETVTRAQASIRDRPLLSVLIAFVIGLVFGKLFARK